MPTRTAGCFFSVFFLARTAANEPPCFTAPLVASFFPAGALCFLPWPTVYLALCGFARNLLDFIGNVLVGFFGWLVGDTPRFFWSRRLARVFEQTLEASDTVPSRETAFLPPVACINAQMNSTRHAVIRALMRFVSSFSCSADHAAGT